ncbi:hypothetical protein ACFL2V_14695 [Pseudomonadota bacterium]
MAKKPPTPKTNPQPNIYIIIPTIRNLVFLHDWVDALNNCHLIIVEDRKTNQIEKPTSSSYNSVHHYSWEDIESDLGVNEWIISRNNAGIRSYGFYKAWQMSADVIITLDDDCYPQSKNYVQNHLDNLNFKAAPNWVASYPDPTWMYTRGFPYNLRNQIPTAISHGLWSGALDLDGKTEIKLPTTLTEKPYPPIRQYIPSGYYYPMCSMNLAFAAEFASIMFFPMMGHDSNGKGWGIDRFDDIWAGILSKKILDHLGYSVVNGSPLVEHRKASDPGANCQKEKTGIRLNEDFWKWVDATKLTQSTPKNCYIELAKKIRFPDTHYFTKLREAMIIWANLF